MMQQPSQTAARRRTIIFLYSLILVVLGGVFLELSLRVYHYQRYGEWKSAAEIRDPNAYTQNLYEREGCSFQESLYPHPFLGFVQHNAPPCHSRIVNNSGIVTSKDLTFEKSPDIYKLLLTGGSSPELYAQSSMLEKTLNQCYVPPHGKKRFGVWKGAMGAWSQPQQTIYTLLYGAEFDGVLSLEGFNEWKSRGNRHFFISAPGLMLKVNPLLRHDLDNLVTMMLLRKIGRFPLIDHSHVFALLWQYAAHSFSNVSDRKTIFKHYYTMPRQWSSDKQVAHWVQTHLHYIRAFHSIAKNYGLDFALFIQPVPAIGKSLTKKEKAVVGDLAYKQLYLHASQQILSLNREGIVTVSLLDIFEEIEYDIYRDHVHFIDQKQFIKGEKSGNQILNEEIVPHLAKNWGFKRRSNQPAVCP